LIAMSGLIVFMNFILPSLALTLGQIKILVLWGLTLMGAFSVFVAGLEEAARKQSRKISGKLKGKYVQP
jgi:hypothetical protein